MKLDRAWGGVVKEPHAASSVQRGAANEASRALRPARIEGGRGTSLSPGVKILSALVPQAGHGHSGPHM
jgi:hypothetical protein